uniref:(northern house mosquito) hypothetical protein n=1 Tax=Culex pipiens TaxID=7175 RepID=A0A8D8AHB0_CULPI
MFPKLKKSNSVVLHICSCAQLIGLGDNYEKMCSKNNSMNKRFLCTIDCFLVCFLTYTIRIFLAQQCIIYCLTSYKYITISIVSFFIQCFFFVDFFESARKLVFSKCFEFLSFN